MPSEVLNHAIRKRVPSPTGPKLPVRQRADSGNSSAPVCDYNRVAKCVRAGRWQTDRCKRELDFSCRRYARCAVDRTAKTRPANLIYRLDPPDRATSPNFLAAGEQSRPDKISRRPELAHSDRDPGRIAAAARMPGAAASANAAGVGAPFFSVFSSHPVFPYH